MDPFCTRIPDLLWFSNLQQHYLSVPCPVNIVGRFICSRIWEMVRSCVVTAAESTFIESPLENNRSILHACLTIFPKQTGKSHNLKSCRGGGKQRAVVPSGYAHFVTIKSLASHMAIVCLIIWGPIYFFSLSVGVKEVFAEKNGR